MRHGATILGGLLVSLTALQGCSRSASIFSDHNARAHVQVLAGLIGSRPTGTPENARARAYVIDQLKLYGYAVRVQETDARRSEFGLTARVANIIAVLPGTRSEAIGLLSHYDSSPDAPGAADDAFGVAVSLEAARIIATKPRQWTTMVLVTDAEETGLMGAAALVHDREVTDRLHAYLNLEASGSSGVPLLFETGPGNHWLVRQWARAARYPRGGSFAMEIYARLPNDTDFSILRRLEIPGLNFAIVEDSYAYHTARDTPERLSPRSLRTAGENVISIVEALQQTDITRRTSYASTYFDVGGMRAVAYSAWFDWLLTALAVALGGVGWLRVTRFVVLEEGPGRWLLGFAWTAAGVAVVAGAMIGATWLLRTARETYHPWYARPDRFFAMLVVVAAFASWIMARAGRWIPARAHGLRHPAVVWTYTLPLWIVLAVVIGMAGAARRLLMDAAPASYRPAPGRDAFAARRLAESRLGGDVRSLCGSVPGRPRAPAVHGGSLRTTPVGHAGVSLRGVSHGGGAHRGAAADRRGVTRRALVASATDYDGRSSRSHDHNGCRLRGAGIYLRSAAAPSGAGAPGGGCQRIALAGQLGRAWRRHRRQRSWDLDARADGQLDERPLGQPARTLHLFEYRPVTRRSSRRHLVARGARRRWRHRTVHHRRAHASPD